MSSETNWAAISALAAAVAASVAFLTYVAPHHPAPTPAQTTPPVWSTPPAATAPPPIDTTTTETSDTAPPPASPRSAGPPLTVAPLPPGGCTDALAAVDKYYRTAGSTTLSQDAAASQAYQDMMGANLETNGGAVYTVTVALSRDFSNMRFILEGMVDGDYAAAQAQTNADAQTLRNICG